jgi:hypothetical protein
MNIYEVTLRGHLRPTTVTVKALNEASARQKFDAKEVIAITSLKRIELGKISLVKGGVIA